ncbi:MAG: HdeD family acid-resistance protein [Acetobacteraceae bacterium]
MSTSTSAGPDRKRPQTGWFWFVLLGLLMILLGAFAWIDVVVATIAGTVLIGATLLVGGILQVLHSFLDRDWGTFALHLLSGVLYAIGGLLIMAEPLKGAFILTIALAAVLIVAGVFRLLISVRNWQVSGAGLLLIGGIVSIAVGIGLYLLLPWSGLWVLGTLIAIELILHGAAWLEFGLGLRRLRRV